MDSGYGGAQAKHSLVVYGDVCSCFRAFHVRYTLSLLLFWGRNTLFFFFLSS